MKNVIIAFVGMCGTGKSMAIDYLKNKYNLPTIYFGGLVLDELVRRGMQVNSENEKFVREDLRDIYGMGAIAKLALSKIDLCLKTDSTITVDGLYSYSEYLLLKEKYGNIILIAIHADKFLRFERLKKRKIRPLSKEEIAKRDHFEIINLEKGGPIAIADFHILNNDNEILLFEQIDKVLKRIIHNYDRF
jgi:dephospho-CoA kinase